MVQEGSRGSRSAPGCAARPGATVFDTLRGQKMGTRRAFGAATAMEWRSQIRTQELFVESMRFGLHLARTGGRRRVCRLHLIACSSFTDPLHFGVRRVGRHHECRLVFADNRIDCTTARYLVTYAMAQVVIATSCCAKTKCHSSSSPNARSGLRNSARVVQLRRRREMVHCSRCRNRSIWLPSPHHGRKGYLRP